MRRAATAGVITVAALIAGFALWRAAATSAPSGQPHVVKPAALGGAPGGGAAALAETIAVTAAGASAGASTIAASAKTLVAAGNAPGGDASDRAPAAHAEVPSGRTPGGRAEPAGGDERSAGVEPKADARAGQAGQAAPSAGTRHAADPSGIMSAVQTAVPAIKDCYAAWGKQQPGLAGALKVAMTIGVDPAEPSRGKVVGARIADNELQSAAVQGCLLNALDGLEFERPQGGKVEVTLPFRFDMAGRGRATQE
jgi:hypothetical protein